MATKVTIYQITDNSDPALYDSYFPTLKEAEEYAKEECDHPLGPFPIEIELTKKGVCAALKKFPWR